MKEGWIYICFDPKDISICKIGMTNRPVHTRIAETTTNPHYTLFCAYKVPPHEAKWAENIIHKKIMETGVRRIFHKEKSRKSEWFEINAFKASKYIEWLYTHLFAGDFYSEEDYATGQPTQFKNVKYIPEDTHPADYNQLQRIHDQYLMNAQKRQQIDIDSFLY